MRESESGSMMLQSLRVEVATRSSSILALVHHLVAFYESNAFAVIGMSWNQPLVFLLRRPLKMRSVTIWSYLIVISEMGLCCFPKRLERENNNRQNVGRLRDVLRVRLPALMRWGSSFVEVSCDRGAA